VGGRVHASSRRPGAPGAHGEAGRRGARDRLPRRAALRVHDRTGAQRGRRSRHALGGRFGRLPTAIRARVIHSLRRTLPARGGAPMKIVGIDTFTLRIPTVKPIAPARPEPRLVVPRVHSDAGPEGLGYSLVFGGAGSEAVEAYARRLGELLIGEDPLLVGRLWDKMYRADRGIRRVGIAGYALSALDIALWDLAGKTANLPLAKLWGATTDRVDAYGSGGWGSYSI